MLVVALHHVLDLRDELLPASQEVPPVARSPSESGLSLVEQPERAFCEKHHELFSPGPVRPGRGSTDAGALPYGGHWLQALSRVQDEEPVLVVDIGKERAISA